MAFFKKGEKKKNHKYIARIGESPNYRYFYTQAEFDAYQKFQNGVKTIAKASTSLLKSGAKAYTSLGKQFLSNVLSDTKNKVSNAKNVVSDIRKNIQSVLRNKANESVKEINKAKKSIVSKISNRGIAHFIDKTVDKLTGQSQTDTEEKNKNNKNNKKIRDSLDEKSKKIMDSWLKETDKMLAQINKPNPKTKEELKKKDKEMSAYNDMQRVNPYYLEDYSFQYNCVYCSTAYDLRRRGYDVEADDYHFGTESDEGINTFDFEYKLYTHNNAKSDLKTKVSNFFASFSNDPNAKKKAVNEALYPGTTFEYGSGANNTITDTQISKIEKDILSQGEGARGSFILTWANGNDGHSVVYEVENGKVVLRDCQLNKVVEPAEYLKYSSSVKYFRTDNEDITDDALKCVKNKTEDTTNPGKSGKPKTTPYALANKYEQSGYKVNSVVVDGEVFYKVYISDNQCLFIDESGRIEYGDSGKY